MTIPLPAFQERRKQQCDRWPHRETFVRGQRYLGMTQPDIWYVAFGPDKAVKTDPTVAGTVRSTRTFKTEVDAKLFAMQILAKGWSASAGTLNPYQPKQIIPPSEVHRWADPSLDGEHERSVNSSRS